ncbi:MAG TPA: nitroreductase family deazaflavin-dependent oxidoreductase [Mycobacterium sp.]|jgi:deazaflavin-dependent oxidoreductase (nitroreductase family)|nr:nitroreductase family deazaflavin-dependent oxidoreductase [Mycobacterium sp.]
MKIIKRPHPPAGLRRLLFRSPIWIYRLGVGAVFGRRLLLLNHTGRVTGEPRQTILEVAQYDPTDCSYVVASGWGPDAAWYRNILEQPQVSIQVGSRTIPVTAEPLPEDVGAEIFAHYAAQRPRIAAFVLPRVLGMAVDGSDDDFRAVGRRMPFVRLTPRR